jgi:DNA-binding response OmpR family regulator
VVGWIGTRKVAARMRILVVDGDANFLDQVVQILEDADFEVISAREGRLGLLRSKVDQPDLALVDVRLPSLNGLEVCRRIKRTSGIPVIVLTPEGDEHSVIRAMDAGAEDYVVKPLVGSSLVTRIRAALRRSYGNAHASARLDTLESSYTLDPRSLRVTRGDLVVRLTPSEFRILSTLNRNRGQPVSVQQLANQVWGDDVWDDHPEYRSTLKSHISRIRKKLRMRASIPDDIRAVEGPAYVLTCCEHAVAESRALARP